MNVALVDDEPPARRKLRRLLSEAKDVTIVGEAGSGAEAVELLARAKPDLVFLDIQMPDMDGFEVLRLAQRPRMQVVFVTAFDHHAVHAFEAQALDYLLKPVDPQRFAVTLERVRPRVRKPAKITVNTGEASLFLDADEIDLVESARNYVVVHASGRTHLVRCTLESFMEQLDEAKFARISRSQVINLDRVREVRPWAHGDYRVVLQDGRELNWSRRFEPRSRLSLHESR